MSTPEDERKQQDGLELDTETVRDLDLDQETEDKVRGGICEGARTALGN